MMNEKLGKKTTASRVSKGSFTPSSSQNRTWTSRFIRLFKMWSCQLVSGTASHTIIVVIGTLTPCLVNSSIIPCGCFVFNNFYILCIPSLLLIFISFQHYYGYIRPCCCFVKAYYFLRVLRLMIRPLCVSYVLAHLQTFLPISHI
jgi:hypothetical protein